MNHSSWSRLRCTLGQSLRCPHDRWLPYGWCRCHPRPKQSTVIIISWLQPWTLTLTTLSFPLQSVSLSTAWPCCCKNERNERWRIYHEEKDPEVKEWKRDEHQHSSSTPILHFTNIATMSAAITNPSHSQNTLKRERENKNFSPSFNLHVIRLHVVINLQNETDDDDDGCLHN